MLLQVHDFVGFGMNDVESHKDQLTSIILYYQRHSLPVADCHLPPSLNVFEEFDI